jgi:hypothetical protein
MTPRKYYSPKTMFTSMNVKVSALLVSVVLAGASVFGSVNSFASFQSDTAAEITVPAVSTDAPHTATTTPPRLIRNQHLQ